MIGTFVIITGILALLFRKDIQKYFEKMTLKSQTAEELSVVLPNVTISKRWRVEENILGELSLSSSAKTNEQVQETFENLAIYLLKIKNQTIT